MPIAIVYCLFVFCVCAHVCVCVTVCVCVCTVTNFSAENKACGSSASKAGNLPFFVKLLPQKPKIRRICERAGHAHPHVIITVVKRRRKHHARDALFVKSRGVWT